MKIYIEIVDKNDYSIVYSREEVKNEEDELIVKNRLLTNHGILLNEQKTVKHIHDHKGNGVGQGGCKLEDI